MNYKTIDSINRMDVKGNQVNETKTEEKTKKTEEGYGRKEVGLKREYDAISKNGDTLELSENGKKMAEHSVGEDASPFGKKIISDTGKKISESTLAGFSEAKLKQLYANKEITRQQYERIMKRKKTR